MESLRNKQNKLSSQRRQEFEFKFYPLYKSEKMTSKLYDKPFPRAHKYPIPPLQLLRLHVNQ